MLKNIVGKYGLIHYFGKDQFLGKSLERYGEFSKEETARLLELAGSGIVLDIGANIGAISQAMGYHGIACDAYEVHPQIFKVLQKNVNRFPSVKVFNLGCSSSDRDCVMPVIDPKADFNFGGMSVDTSHNLGTVDCKLVKLDGRYSSKVSLIKIDVEGHELEVLRGAVELIKRDKPVLYIEDDRPEKSAELREFVKSLGYTIKDHNTPLYPQNNHFKNTKNVFLVQVGNAINQYVSYNIECHASSI